MSKDTVVLLSGHVPLSKRKAGFHWIADSCCRKKWNTIFVTVDLSYSARRAGDHRFANIDMADRCKLKKLSDGYYHYFVYHPLSIYSRIATRFPKASKVFFWCFENMALPELHFNEADVIIFESGMGLYWGKRILKQCRENTRLVYRVSDDLSLRNLHPSIYMAEKYLLPHFDLISTPTPMIYEKYKEYKTTELNYHGCAVELFENDGYINPYHNSEYEKQAVYVGCSSLDREFIKTAASLLTHVQFNIIGPFAPFSTRSNVKFYGELPYKECIPFIKHADVALNPLVLPSFVHSNKMQQYKWCRLPVVMSDIDSTSIPYIFHYKPNDRNSVRQAIIDALHYDRSQIPKDEVRSWMQLTDVLLGQ